MIILRQKVIENERFTVYNENGRLLGEEKTHEVYTGHSDLFIQEITPDISGSIKSGFDALAGDSVFKEGDLVAIKVNLGGGIHGVLSSYTDPDLVCPLVEKLRAIGVKPFICEADMRGHEMTQVMLRERGYLSLCRDMKVPFVNLSKIKQVQFKFHGIHKRVSLPFLLLKPDVKIISFAPPKHHWECGITCAQKNMYGAIGNFRKSQYHRKYELIDHVVAGAARIMKPDLCMIGSKQLGAGLGPHFCVPVNFYRMIYAKDMLSCDKFCAEILGYPIDLVLYHQINRQNQAIHYNTLSGSTAVDKESMKKIHANNIPPEEVRKYKNTLWIQYYIPSLLQFKTYRYFEWLLTWMNHKFYVPLGDSPIF